MTKQRITFSRQDCFKVCRKRHWFSYELGIRRATDAKALRMGSAYHAGLEALAQSDDRDVACAVIDGAYADVPDSMDNEAWAMECMTVRALLAGYKWRWKESPLQVIATERGFQFPLTNPATGSPSLIFDLAGKIDGIVMLEDGRLVVQEYKLLGEDIGSDADLWRRLQIDQQISIYIHGARQLGYRVDAVLYDVTRKPTIKPNPVPLCDDNGMPIVLDADGNRVLTAKGEPRKTGDTAKGYVLQTRPMSLHAWEDKLFDDIVARPNYYYQRREIARLDDEIAELQAELWDIQKTIREAQNTGRWFRTCNRNTCSWCDYFDLCSSKRNIESDGLPEGFVYVEDVHPELNGGNRE